MSKVKLRSVTVTSLLLVLLIGVISYGCAANKNANSVNTIVVNNQSTKQSQINSSAVITNNSQSKAINANSNGATAGNDGLLATKINQQSANLNSLDNSYNRLRPEIKRILQSKFSSDAELQTALKGASILQDYLDRPNQDAVAMIKRYDCKVISLTQADQNLIQSLTFDTDERKNKIKNGLKDYQPPVSIEIEIDGSDNAVSPCSSIK